MTPRFVIFDAESSDLFRKDLALDDPTQPFIVELAAELVDASGEVLDAFHTRVRAPEGRTVKPGAEAVHGISSRRASKEGVSEIVALGMLCQFAAQATHAVGHAVEFDRMLVESRLRVTKKDPRMWIRPGLEFVDTMQIAAPFCRIQTEHDSGSYKWPSLDIACETLLGEPPRQGPHRAGDDVTLTRRLFMALRERGAIDLPEAA